ncbi:MAG: pitrilysin family protein [Acidobacteriota bacterium]|nr:pitrilysin family protein [Acidobacteriota bacterium]
MNNHRLNRLASALTVLGVLLAALAPVATTGAEETSFDSQAQVPVQTFELDNGMNFLLVRQPELTTVRAGWVAHVGSANERPGITGISHFFEHMMFKGSETLGTTDINRDLEIMDELEEIQHQIRAEYRLQRERARLGEIEDPFADEDRTDRLKELQARFDELMAEQRELMVKNEFDRIYTENGATGLNAFTSYDLTGYFITLPANKAELWFWLESDRLLEPVFREFYTERDVVYEERRLRTESTPTGEFDELFDAMFWQSHPYGWPVVGWPSDLEVYTMAQAKEYYDTYYAANNLTAVLVGDFDVDQVKEMAQRYFGRLPTREEPAPDVVTMEIEQRAEKRMVAECDCQPQIQVAYHTVPFRHRDSYVLDVLSGLLNGPTGRLYKSLVLDQEIATSASSYQDSRKYAGRFGVTAETKGDATPEQLEQAWYQELRRLAEEPIPERELQKVKNRIAADAFRRLENPFFLLLQLIIYDGLGDWEYINYWADKTLAVSAEDVQRVAKEYFDPTNRTVGLYYRNPETEAQEVPPELEGLEPQMRTMIQAQLKQIQAAEDPAMLESLLNQLAAQSSQMPPEMQPVVPLLERALRERIDELRAAETGDETAEGGES